jgi:hypothetical protein
MFMALVLGITEHVSGCELDRLKLEKYEAFMALFLKSVKTKLATIPALMAHTAFSDATAYLEGLKVPKILFKDILQVGVPS